MKRYVSIIKKAAAVLVTAAVVFSGCSSSGSSTPEADTETLVTSQDTTTAPAETTSATPETTEPEELYPKGVNPVRTAEELEGKKVIALTFDDGPNTKVTNDILDIVEQYGIKVSFYVIGQNITEESAVVMQRAHSLGCEINSHSFTHSYMDKMTAEEIKEEMDKTAGLIYNYVGEYPKFFRPPYIAVSDIMYDTIDLPFISGNGCNDWEDRVTVEARVRFLTMKCPEGSIILMHDQETNTKTVDALKEAIPIMLEDGFEFVTTEELFIAKGITPSTEKHVIYSYATENGWA